MHALTHTKRVSSRRALTSEKIVARDVNFSKKCRPRLVSGRQTSRQLASDWVKQCPRDSVIFIQKRWYGTESPKGGELPPTSSLAYFKERKLSSEDVKKVRQTTDGVSFKVIPLLANDQQDLNAVKRFINTFFVSPIHSHPDSSALGGEKVLLFNPSDPEKGKPDSSFLMAFDGEQDPHLHAGPRHLDMWSSESWSVIVGGSNPEVLNNESVHFTKIDFPAGHVSLSFRKNMLHGFSGKGIGAISTHWTDAEELEELKQRGGVKSGVKSKELMGTLTQFVPKEKVRIIGEQGIPWNVISDLKRTQPNDD
jgi:hypothetical protein